ncbi:MAG: hypothetical protein HY835_06335 [Anaerolineae bacterium]|nr:hypothetical protein [Anaerolineae bacterium]
MQEKYTAYLLRIWQVEEPSGYSWRAMLENPRTHETFGFASVDALAAFLKDQWNQKETGGDLKPETIPKQT